MAKGRDKLITELRQHDFYKCLNLLNEQGQLEAKAIVIGVNPGRIFVDNPVKPKSGLIWLGNNDGFMLIGDECNTQFNEQLNPFIDDVILPEANKIGLKWFEVIGNHERWNDTIERLFEHRSLSSWNQKVYTLEKQHYKSEREPLLPEGYSVQRVNKSFYGNGSIQNMDFLHNIIEEFWASPAQFFKEGIAYGIVFDNKLVSLCFSGFVVENFHCVGIETLEAHQGKKLAQVLAHTYVKDCFENNIVPYWDCMEGNKPSVAIAEKLGFSNTFNYIGYEFSI